MFFNYPAVKDLSHSRPSKLLCSPDNLEHCLCGWQGAFILVGSSSIGVPLLLLLLAALLTYCTWRFWEGLAGQGFDESNSNLRNFFRYRLSPVVSGIVYVAYAAFVGSLISKSSTARAASASEQSFPDSWAHSGLGRVGLCLAGIAFLAGDQVHPQGGLEHAAAEHSDMSRIIKGPRLLNIGAAGQCCLANIDTGSCGLEAADMKDCHGQQTGSQAVAVVVL